MISKWGGGDPPLTKSNNVIQVINSELKKLVRNEILNRKFWINNKVYDKKEHLFYIFFDIKAIKIYYISKMSGNLEKPFKNIILNNEIVTFCLRQILV